MQWTESRRSSSVRGEVGGTRDDRRGSGTWWTKGGKSFKSRNSGSTLQNVAQRIHKRLLRVVCTIFFFRPPFYFLRLGGLFAPFRGKREGRGKNKTKTPGKQQKKKPYFPGFFFTKEKGDATIDVLYRVARDVWGWCGGIVLGLLEFPKTV